MMRIVFCKPELTMNDTTNADVFFEECRRILDTYVVNMECVSSLYKINHLLLEQENENNILIFFNAENGVYEKDFIALVTKYNDSKSRIWPIAMEKNPECRCPPKPVSEKQSFDVYCRNENRNPMKNNIKAIAQIFSRKIIAQTLSPLYRDEVLYFISHRRVDGERIAAKLADELVKLTRGRNVYRDVVSVEVGDDAQLDIDKKLGLSDVVIFLQTNEARYSKYIVKELCHAIVNDIPVLWIQIDNASYDKLAIRPSDAPILSYMSSEFDDQERLREIVDEIEEYCFKLMMHSSNQVYSYIDCLYEMHKANKIKLANDKESTLAYMIEYECKSKDAYDNNTTKKHYVQCFGRNPKDIDFEQFLRKVVVRDIYHKNDRLFLLSNHGNRERKIADDKVLEENFDNYLMNIDNVCGIKIQKLNKRIILSGAFPDCDEIYKVSLIEALLVYSREIIKRGYTLVFGAHPTFQQLIFDIAKKYSNDVKYSVEMHMDRYFVGGYNLEELESQCTLVLSNGLQEMRENMICKHKSELLICLGGKIKEDKSQQGVDIEIELAKSVGLPVALVGTVGGRSSEYAFERLSERNWKDLNNWEDAVNENLFYNVNHRSMIRRLIENIEK